MLRTKQTLATSLGLPEPTQLLRPSKDFEHTKLKGIKVDPLDPLNIKFLISSPTISKISRKEVQKLIKTFFTALSISEDKLWVNLSPYEADRISDDELSQTAMGKTILSQDYILKLLSASLTHPKSDTGVAYWSEADKSQLKNIDLSKVWINANSAEIYEENNIAIITNSSLKISSETYKHNAIFPVLNKEINQGKHFSELRQIYNSIILSKWFKENYFESIYKGFINSSNLDNLQINDKSFKKKIFKLYCQSFDSGVYNYISPTSNASKQRRQYFCGGVYINPKISSSPLTEFKQVENNESLLYVSGQTLLQPTNMKELLRNFELPDLSAPSKKELENTRNAFKSLSQFIGTDNKALNWDSEIGQVLIDNIKGKRFVPNKGGRFKFAVEPGYTYTLSGFGANNGNSICIVKNAFVLHNNLTMIIHAYNTETKEKTNNTVLQLGLKDYEIQHDQKTKRETHAPIKTLKFDLRHGGELLGEISQPDNFNKLINGSDELLNDLNGSFISNINKDTINITKRAYISLLNSNIIANGLRPDNTGLIIDSVRKEKNKLFLNCLLFDFDTLQTVSLPIVMNPNELSKKGDFVRMVVDYSQFKQSANLDQSENVDGKNAQDDNKKIDMLIDSIKDNYSTQIVDGKFFIDDIAIHLDNGLNGTIKLKLHDSYVYILTQNKLNYSLTRIPLEEFIDKSINNSSLIMPETLTEFSLRGMSARQVQDQIKLIDSYVNDLINHNDINKIDPIFSHVSDFEHYQTQKRLARLTKDTQQNFLNIDPELLYQLKNNAFRIDSSGSITLFPYSGYEESYLMTGMRSRGKGWIGIIENIIRTEKKLTLIIKTYHPQSRQTGKYTVTQLGEQTKTIKYKGKVSDRKSKEVLTFSSNQASSIFLKSLTEAKNFEEFTKNNQAINTHSTFINNVQDAGVVAFGSHFNIRIPELLRKKFPIKESGLFVDTAKTIDESNIELKCKLINYNTMEEEPLIVNLNKAGEIIKPDAVTDKERDHKIIDEIKADAELKLKFQKAAIKLRDGRFKIKDYYFRLPRAYSGKVTISYTDNQYHLFIRQKSNLKHMAFSLEDADIYLRTNTIKIMPTSETNYRIKSSKSASLSKIIKQLLSRKFVTVKDSKIKLGKFTLNLDTEFNGKMNITMDRSRIKLSSQANAAYKSKIEARIDPDSIDETNNQVALELLSEIQDDNTKQTTNKATQKTIKFSPSRTSNSELKAYFDLIAKNKIDPAKQTVLFNRMQEIQDQNTKIIFADNIANRQLVTSTIKKILDTYESYDDETYYTDDELDFLAELKDIFSKLLSGESLNEISIQHELTEVLSEDSIQQLLANARPERLKQYQSNLSESIKLKNTLITANMGLIVYVAKKFHYWSNSDDQFNADLISEGITGLKKAVEKFDPKLGHQFSPLASWEIRSTLDIYHKTYSNSIKLTTNSKVKYYSNLKSIYKLVTDEQISFDSAVNKFFNNKSEKLLAFLKVHNISKIHSLDAPIKDGTHTTHLDNVSSDDYEAIDNIELSSETNYTQGKTKTEFYREKIFSIYSHISRSPEEDTEIFLSYFGLLNSSARMNSGSLSKQYKISRQRVNQKIDRAINRIKSNPKLLMEFKEILGNKDYESSSSINGGIDLSSNIAADTIKKSTSQYNFKEFKISKTESIESLADF